MVEFESKFGKDFDKEHKDFEKSFKRTFIISAVISIGFIMGIACILIALGKASKQRVNEIEQMVGKKVIFNNDTVMIVDYSSWHKTYKFDNGIDVSFELVKVLKEVE